MKRSSQFIRIYRAMPAFTGALLSAVMPWWANAGPAGGQIVGGRGSITHPNNNLTEIHQSSNRLAIDWQSFDVNANEVVKFLQPSAQSIALNRILDSKQSLILGRLEANGRLFLINPRGIIFGKGATVNVAGLVASSLDIDPHDFIKGNFTFTDKGGDGVIVNQGTIEAAVGGAVVLLGKVVINEGEISAPRGSAQLVSAGGAVISFDDNNQLGIQVTAEQAQKIANQTDAVRNSGKISAEGGYIALTGATTADLFTNAVNNTGVLVANSARSHNGVIELTGGSGNVAQSGVVDTSAHDGSNGGTISISGNTINHSGQLNADGATGGDIQLHATDLILTKDNAMISATGSDGNGGHIELLGDRVGLMDHSRIDTSGATGGGVVHLGGEFHGAGPRNAKRTVVDNGVSIYADAKNNGNGGEVVLWSDDVTYFVGNIFARGGANGGDGGNIEVSSKGSLGFNGRVDIGAPHGKAGSLLLDPSAIVIHDQADGAQAQDTGTANVSISDSIINGGDSPATYNIGELALEALTGNITLTATQSITINSLTTDGVLLFNPGAGNTVTFNVNATSGTAAFTMANTSNEIRVNNGNLAINVTNTANTTSGAANATLGKLTTATSGNIAVTASSTCTYPGSGSCTAGAVSVSSGAISAAGSVSAQGASQLNSTASGGGATTNGVTMSLGTINAGSTVTVSGTSTGTSGSLAASIGAVAITTGNITGGGNVSVTGTTSADTVGGSGVTAGNVGVTTGSINTSGTVTTSTSSTAHSPAGISPNAGTATTTVGAITTSGAVTLSSTSNSSNGIGTQAGNVATVTATDISITGNAPLQITAASSNSNTENVHISGNYIDNGGNETITSYTLTLDGNAVLDTTGTISLNYTNLVTNGFTLTQGAINNIWVGDISGSAVAGDLGFSQANITAFAGTGLVLSAHNNIYLGNATVDSPNATSITLTADSDHSGAGDISIAAGKTFNLNGKNLIASGANATINGSITNSGTGSQQFTTTSGITMGSGSSLTSGSGNIALNAGTGITMASNAAITSTTGQLALTAANNIALGSLSTGNTTTSAVNVTSTAGAISNAGAATNISASAAGSRVALNAVSGINAALSIADLTLTNSTSGAVSLTNNRALQISSFTNTPATTSSITTTGASSDMTIAGNVSSGSNLTLTSSGAFTVNDGFTVNSNAGTLAINATGNAAITGLQSSNNTASAISVISGGAISDNGTSNLDITDTQASGVVTLQAANGIGASGALDLSIANLSLSNSTSGAVALTNNRSLQINSFTNTPATTSSITTTGGGNITIAGNVSSGSNLALTSAGTFTVNNGNTVNSNAGTLSINSVGDAAITGLTTTNTSTSAISVTSSAGAITDNGDTNRDITAAGVGSRVTLSAINGIGSANALELSILDLIATNTTSNGINLSNNNALQISGVTNTPATSTTITTTGAGSNMTVAGNIASGSNIALTSSGTFSVTDGFTINPTAGTLSINATGNAAITGLTTTNNTASAISVISGGAITDNGDTNLDITATGASAVVMLQAATGIGASNALDLAIANLSLSNSTSGAVALTNNRSLQINSFTNTPVSTASITTTGGGNMTVAGNVSSGSDLTLTSSGAFTVNDGSTVNSNAGTLAINATGNAAITGLQSSNNTASAISVISGGAISDNGATNLDITDTQASGVVTLQAASGIGAAGALDLSIANLALTNSTSNGVALTNTRSLQINSFTNTPVTTASVTTTGVGSNMTIAGNVASGSNLTLTSSGTFTVNDGSTVNSNAGTLAINATGNAAITGLQSSNNSASAISVISGGAISDNGDTNADITATQASATATLQAASGIGNSNAIDFNATNISVTNGASGDIRLHALGSYTFGAINNSSSAGGAVALSSDNNLTVNSITTSNGAITLGAVNAVTLAAGAALASTGGNVSITADTDAAGTSALTMASNSTINSGTGTITLSARGDTAITGLTSANSTGSAISVTSSLGAITDAGADNLADITTSNAGSGVTLSAATGIGSANAIDLNLAGTLGATNSSSGNIALHALNSFTFGNITNSANTGAVALSSDNNLTVNSITTSNGAITVGAVNAVTLASGAALASTGGNVSITADTDAAGTSALTMASTSSINSGTGTIALSARGDTAITGLTSANSTGSAISVTSSLGAITDAGADNLADITTSNASSGVTLSAATGIGSANAIDINLAGTITANNTTGGSIGLHALNSYTFGAITNSFATGAVALSSDGNLTVNNITTNNGAITLGAADNVTLNTGAALQSSGGNIAITADTNANNIGAITMGTGTINSGAGTIALSAAQDINLNQLTTTNATTSAVSITSSVGKILGNSNGTSDITAINAGARVNLHAATGIDAGGSNPLELSVLDLIATNSTSGSINLTNDHALQISGVTNTPVSATTIVTTGVGSNMTVAGSVASGSNLTLTSSGAFTVNDGSTVNSNAGTLSINAAGDAAITGLTTTNNTGSAVSIISGGAITDSGDTNRDITATGASAVVTLQAANGIGAANALDLAIANLSLSNSAAGAVNLTNNRALQINSLINTPVATTSVTTTGVGSNMTIVGNISSGSDIALTSSATLTVVDGSTVNANAGTIAINATGGAAITGLTTTNNTASAVSVISGGAITDSGNSALDITATQANAVVTLQAANGIGAANALDLSIGKLALTNSSSGAVALTNNRALQINSFANTPLTTASVTTTGVGSNLTVAGNVSSSSNLTLTSSGTFTVNDGSTVNSNAGTLSINAAGDAAITGLTTTNNTSSAVSVISGGAITDNGDTNLDITATGASGVVTLQAVNGIGAANALDLAIANLSLLNTTSGAVALTNNRALQINSFANTPASTASITTTGAGSNMIIAGNVASGSDIALTSSGNFTVNDGFTINPTAGTIAINATGNAAITGLTTTNNTASAISVISGGAISDNGNTALDITDTQANAVVTLQAANGIGAANALDVSIGKLALTNSTSGAVALTNNRALQINSLINTPLTTTTITTTGVGSNMTVAGNIASGSNIALNSSGTFIINDGSTVNANAGTLAINAVGDAAITGLTTTNNTGSAVSVISGGAITDNGDTNLDITATGASAVVTLQAANGIGAANPLDLSIANLSLSNSTSGAVNLSNNRALQINSLTNTPATTTTITTTGIGSNMIVAGNVSSGSDLTLISSGTFTVNDGSTVNSNAGTLAINSTGNASITGLTTTNTTGSAVSVISGGAILDNGDTNADITATQSGAVITLTAASGIGNGNAIDINGQVTAINGSSGDIGLHILGSYTFGAIDNSASANGAVVLASDGSLTVGSITTTNGAITLSAADNVSLASNAALQSSGGAVSITADTNANGVGAINMGSGTINSGAGTIALSAAQNITLNQLTTTNATTNAVSITSTAGKILGNSDGVADITAIGTGARVNLHAATGIDAGVNPLELSVLDLIATNSTSGGINLTNDRALQLSGVTNTPVGTTTIATTGVGSNMIVAGNIASGSDIALNSSGTFTVNNGNTVNSNAGTLTITAAGDAAITGLSTTNNTANAVHVTSSGGAILDNGDTNADITATQAGGVVTLQAANGIGTVANAIDINVASVTANNGASGDIGLHALGSFTFGAISNSANAGAVVLSGDGNFTVSNITTNNGAITLGAADNISFASNAVLQSTGGAVAITADTNTNGVGAINMGSGTINSGAGTIALNAAQNITLNQLTTTNATTNAVSVTSTAGKILGNFDGVADITAIGAGARVNLYAAAGIDAGVNPLELSVNDLIATNSTSGGINLTNDRALQISGVTNTPVGATTIATTGVGSNMIVAGNISSGSNIALNSSGTFTINDGSTVNSNAGTLAINAVGDAAITGLTTSNNTGSAVSVISGGSITDNGDTNLDITATGASAVVTLQAANGIGAANPLDLSIANLSLSNSTGGAVDLTNNRALQINSLTNTPATTTTITTTGIGSNMIVAGNIASGSDIALTSSGTFTVNDGVTINPTAGTIAINATGNAAITGLTTTNNTANAIRVISGGTITDAGDTNADLTATGVSAVVNLQAASGIGTAANALDISGRIAATNGSSGDIALHALGSYTFGAIDNSASVNGAVVLASDGNLTVGNITTSNGAITLSAADNISLSPAAALQSTGGAVAITADTNTNGVGAINMGSGTINSGAGTIALSAAQDINLNRLTTTNATTSAVSITSTAGKILGNSDGVADITAIGAGARVNLHAATGIDAGSNPLELSVNDLIATNLTSGGINLTNDRALQITSLSNTPATTAAVTTTAGNLTIAGATSSGGDLTLQSSGNMTVAGNTASAGNMSLTSGGTFTVNDGSTVNSNTGTLAINSAGNASITGLQSSNTSANAIRVISGGAILDSGDTNADISATQAGAIVTLQAASGIGNGNAIDIAGQIAASNGTSGDIGLHALGSYTFGAIDNSASANGAVILASDGNLTVNNITTNNGAITLSAADNVSLSPAAALQSSGGAVAITADTNTNGVGAINMGSGTIDSGAGTIALSAAQDVNLNRLITSNTTTNAVSITSTAGKILGNSDGIADITAIGAGARVNLHAAAGIDAGVNPLELSVNDLIATNSTSGGINLTNDRALQISGITNTPVTTTTITTTGVGSNMTVAGNVASGSNIALNSSGTFTVNDGNTVNSSAGTLAINAAGDAAITGLQSSNNTNGAVSVISGGAITDSGDTNRDITATQANAVVNLQAANGIGAANPLDLSIANLSLSNSTGGAVDLTNNRALQINSLTNTPATTTTITTTGIGSNMIVAGNIASGSDIALTSSGTFSVTDGFTINPTAGTLSINATGDAAITGLTTTNNTASAISVISGGAITDNGNSALDITATQPNAVVTLQAANGIGAANALDVSIGKLALTNTSSGAVALTNNRVLQINSLINTPLTTTSITTTGVGSNMIVAGNVSSGSNLSLTSSGTFTVNDGNTVNSNTGTLAINSVGDAAITGLQSSNNTNAAVSVISGGAIIDNGDTALDITATQANAVVTLQAANGIGAANPLDLSIANLSLSNSTGGAVDLTNNRALQINSLTNTPATTTTIITTAGDLTIAGATSSGGDLTLQSSGNMIVGGNTASIGNMALTSGGAFTVNDGNTVNSNTGTLAINATGDASITGLTTTNNTANAIRVISSGAILDSGDTNADVTATQASAVVTLQAASGIGNGNAIDIAGQIAATNGSSGDIGLHALSNYTFGAIDNGASTNGAVVLGSDGNLTVSNITTSNGAITLSAADNVALASNAILQSNGGAVVITADTNTNGVGAINMGSGTINSGAGTIALSAAQDINLNRLTTTNATTNAVSITSTAGKILGNSDGVADITATSAGARVNLHAATGIDAGVNPLELSVNDLIATNSTSGGINLTNDRALQLSGVTNTPVGATTIATTGIGSDMTVAGNVASGGNLTLASSGKFTVNDGNTVNSNASTLAINSTGDATITGLQTSNNTANAIRVISGGAILDSGDTNADVTATQASAVVTLQAASGIGNGNAIDIAGQIAATNGSSGDIGLHALGNYTFGAIDNSASTNGAVVLASDGNLTVSNITTSNGAITLSAADNVALASNAILQSNGGAVAITADTNTNGVGAINMGSGTINSGAGTIALSAAQNITLNQLTTTNATTNAVSITSTAGKILGNSDGVADITAIGAGARVNLHAATGIDAGVNPLELSVNDLIATNSTSGGINLTNDRALQISGVTNTPVGTTTIATTGVSSNMIVAGNISSGSNIALNSSGTFTVNDGSTVNSNAGTLSINAVGDVAITGLQSSNNTVNAVHVTSSGGAILDNGDTHFDIDAAQPNAIITLQAASGIGNGNELEISGVIAATNGGSGDIGLHTLGSYSFGTIDNSASPNGAVVLISDGNLTVSNIKTTNGIISLSATNDVTLAPNALLQSNGGDVSINSNTGAINMGSSAINSGVGTIALSAAQDITLNQLTTTNATTNAVSVTSTTGKILGTFDGAADITATGAGSRVTLSAATGIDAGSNPLELSVNNLLAINSTSGGINITNNRALQISGITNTPATTTTITTTGVGSNMTVAGNIASGSNIALNSSGVFTVNNGNTVNSNAGTLAINASGDAAISGLQSSNNTTNAISVISGGAIADSGDINADITATQANAVVTLQAANGVGSAANALDINVTKITATNGSSGDIGLHALGNHAFGAIDNSASSNGAVALSSDGNLTTANVTTANGAIVLGALGQIAIGNGASVTSNGGNISLNAGTDIAMASNALITSTSGQLALTAATGITANTSVGNLSVTNSTSGAVVLTNDRTLQVNSLVNNANGTTTIAATGANSDLIFAGTLQNGGGDATLTATRNIDLQNVANVAALTTNSAAVNYAQSITAGSISSTGTANVAGNLTGTTGNIDLQTVVLGAGAHTLNTVSGNDINVGAVTGNSDLQLSSGRNISVANAALGNGNLSASSAANGTFTANGAISASAVTVNKFATANLQSVDAGSTLDVTAATINLGDNLLSNGAMTLTGTTQLQKDIALSTTGTNAVLLAANSQRRALAAVVGGTGGGALQLAGSVNGNGHALSLAAGNSIVCIACTPGSSATGLASLDIQSSIKTVLGTTSVNGNATIRADQEIYLNGDTTITGNLSLLADANNDGIGIAGLLTGKTLSVGGTLTVQPIALTSISTPAQCAAPTGFPQMPSVPPLTPDVPTQNPPTPLTNTDVQIAIQEGEKYGIAASDAMLRNAPQIAYLSNNCPSDPDHKNREMCNVDASMMDFLGTFLIDNQIPKNGSGQ